MVALSTVLGAVTALPSIVAGIESTIGAIQSVGRGESTFGGGEGGRFPVVNTGPSVGPQVGINQAGGVAGVIPRIAAPVIRAIPPLLGGAAGTAVVTQLGQAPAAGARPVTKRQAILSQARFFSPGATAKKIVRSARECGIELASQTFGLSVLDVCFLIAQPPTRRARGISAADLRRTRSTIRKVGNIQRDLKRLSGPIRRK